MKMKEIKIVDKKFTELTDKEIASIFGGQQQNTNSGPVPVYSKHGPIHVTD